MTRTAKATAITALKDIGATVAGIRKAYDVDELPASLDTAKLPCLLHFDNGTDVVDLTAARGYVEEVHHILVKIVIEAAAQKRLQDNIKLGMTLYDRYFAALMTTANASTTNWAYCTMTGASALGAWAYPEEIPYHALDILVDIHVYS